MIIDRRIRAKEFMQLLSVGRAKFYKMIKTGEIQNPVRLSDFDVFWYESDVKKEVEKYKKDPDMIAC